MFRAFAVAFHLEQASAEFMTTFNRRSLRVRSPSHVGTRACARLDHHLCDLLTSTRIAGGEVGSSCVSLHPGLPRAESSYTADTHMASSRSVMVQVGQKELLVGVQEGVWWAAG